MPEHVAKIRAKGLDTTGFDEALIERLWKKANGGKPGDYVVGVFELQSVEAHGPTIEGKRRLDLVLTIVEPARETDTEAALRELMRAMVGQRRVDNGELPLDGTIPDLDAARSGALARVERDADGNPIGVWDGDVDAERAKGTNTKATAAKKTVKKATTSK